MPSTLIDDEVLIIENGGEIPEVALHGCLYYLSADPEGPGLVVSGPELFRLRRAVVEGYRKIIVRDLTLENRGRGHYRGLGRSIINWQRLRRFCRREGFDPTPVAAEIRALLQQFLAVEFAEVTAEARRSCINCSLPELLTFFAQVGLDHSRLPAGWQGLVCTV